MADHVDAPPELIDPAPCDCCGVPVAYRRGSLWHGRDLICRPCFWTWYDYGLIDRVELAAKRFELYGRRDG